MPDTPFIERDLSWLSFNHRVLQEAADPTVPLYERLKFLAIYSSNLDEFFRVRVASLRSFRKLAKSTKKEMELKPRKLLRKIHQIVHEQQTEFGEIFREILEGLSRYGIYLVNEQSLEESRKTQVQDFFNEKIAPLLKPVFLKEDLSEPPFLENRAIYFVIKFEEPEKELALVKIPAEELGRFHSLEENQEGHFIIFLDDMLRLGLPSFFTDRKVKGAYAIKVSRDAELYIDDEYSGDLVEKIKKGLEERHVGLPTRFLYDAAMPADVLHRLKDLFDLNKNDLIPGARYHNFHDFFSFPKSSGESRLHDPPMPPLPHPELEKEPSVLAAAGKKDYLLHYPYQKFDTVLRLVDEAAADEQVESIKITLYRVASNSGIAEGLLGALKKGKKVTAFIEAKARFDEESNLFWGEKLAKEGALVRYSYPGIKVHTKLLLISRREEGELRHYTYLSTGNFNEKTAGLYADHALLTSNSAIAEDVVKIFDLLEGKLLVPKCKHLLIAPFNLREGFEKLIDQEIANARNGKDAWMIVKQNSLEDKKMMSKLLEASQAGVKIKMIVRGICCLLPDREGPAENIEIISILDRFLEHARVYIFAAGGKEKMYLASADWMSRNLSRRVEVAFPVSDISLKKEIRQIIDFQLNDCVKARVIDITRSNRMVSSRPNEPVIRSQEATYDFLKSLSGS